MEEELLLESLALLLTWIVLGVVVAIVASSKGRNGFGWFFYGLLVFPIALTHILVLGATPEARQKKAKAEGRVPCHYCGEMIRPYAQVCPYCQKDHKRKVGSP